MDGDNILDTKSTLDRRTIQDYDNTLKKLYISGLTVSESERH